MVAVINGHMKRCLMLLVISCLTASVCIGDERIGGPDTNPYCELLPRDSPSDTFISLRGRLAKIHIVANIPPLRLLPSHTNPCRLQQLYLYGMFFQVFFLGGVMFLLFKNALYPVVFVMFVLMRKDREHLKCHRITGMVVLGEL